MIRTERLLLRPLCRDDLEHIQRYAVRPDYYRYLPIPEQTPESVAAFLEARLAEDAATDKKTWLFAIETHEVGHMIGIIRLPSSTHTSGRQTRAMAWTVIFMVTAI